jgi:hypothetical protein
MPAWTEGPLDGMPRNRGERRAGEAGKRTCIGLPCTIGQP